MKKLFTCLLAVLTVLAAGTASVQARRLPRGVSSILRNVRQLPQTVKPNTLRLSRQAEQAALRARLPSTIYRMALPAKRIPAHNAPIRRNVLPIRETVSDLMGLAEPFTATSFIIEEEFEGKKYLWGITAAHIAHLMSAFPAVWIDEIPFPVEFAALGNADMADIALFQASNLEPGEVMPLKLAEESPLPGEKTFSFGFFNDGFYLVPNREIKEVTPNRLITSLEFDTSNRGGACGGPILNKHGEVVGVHVGSSDSQKISFAVPVSEIKRLLQAYRNNGKNFQKLMFNGLEIGQLNINESIARIRTVTDGYITGDFVAHHNEKDIDYAHLERLSPDNNPEEIQIFISHKAFSFKGKDRQTFFFRLTYNPATQKTTRTVIPSLPV